MMPTNTNLFRNIPSDLPEELFETILANGVVKIERIVSKGHVTPEGEWYDQDKDEWVLLLQGAAIVAFESREPVHLQPGDYLHIPAHLRHRVQWTLPEANTVWLAIHC